jgi:hypothetical protein
MSSITRTILFTTFVLCSLKCVGSEPIQRIAGKPFSGHERTVEHSNGQETVWTTDIARSSNGSTFRSIYDPGGKNVEIDIEDVSTKRIVKIWPAQKTYLALNKPDMTSISPEAFAQSFMKEHDQAVLQPPQTLDRAPTTRTYLGIRTELGYQSVGVHDVTKDPNGENLQMEIWTNQLGVPIEVNGSRAGSRPMNWSTKLTSLELGELSPALFQNSSRL